MALPGITVLHAPVKSLRRSGCATAVHPVPALPAAPIGTRPPPFGPAEPLVAAAPIGLLPAVRPAPTIATATALRPAVRLRGVVVHVPPLATPPAGDSPTTGGGALRDRSDQEGFEDLPDVVVGHEVGLPRDLVQGRILDHLRLAVGVDRRLVEGGVSLPEVRGHPHVAQFEAPRPGEEGQVLRRRPGAGAGRQAD